MWETQQIWGWKAGEEEKGGGGVLSLFMYVLNTSSNGSNVVS